MKARESRWTGRLLSGVLALSAVGGSVLRAQSASDNAKDDLFAGTEKFAQGASEVSEINMDPDSLGLVSGDRAHRAHQMVLNVVRTYGYDKPGMYRMEDVEPFRHKLETGDWHCSVHTRDLKHGDSTDVCNRHRTDGMLESAIITVAPKSLTFIHTIRKAGDPQSQGPSPALSGHLNAGQLPQLAMVGPLLEARMAELNARGAVMDAEMQARLAALTPELQARLHAQAARLEGMRTELSERVRHSPHSERLAPPAPPAPSVPTSPRLPQ